MKPQKWGRSKLRKAGYKKGSMGFSLFKGERENEIKRSKKRKSKSKIRLF